MHNKGNHVFSLARLARFMAERAEELGVMVLPETDAQRLLVADGAVRGIRTGDKGRGRQGEELPTFEPGAELTAHATVLADGVQGMLSGAAVEHFGLQPENPQIYALGVKEVWRVARPLDARRAHDRLAAQAAGALPRVRRHVRLPDGPRHALPRARRRARLRGCLALGARPAAGGQVPPALPAHARGRRAHRLGRQGDPRGRVLVAAGERLPAGRGDPRRRRRLRQRARA